VDNVKICFTIKDKKEKFSFKDHMLYSPAHPQKAYLSKEPVVTRRRTTEEGGRTRPGSYQKRQST
jgi:hypothetical protein